MVCQAFSNHIALLYDLHELIYSSCKYSTSDPCRIASLAHYHLVWFEPDRLGHFLCSCSRVLDYSTVYSLACPGCVK